MRFVTTPTRPLTRIGIGLAAVGVLALPGLPHTPELRLVAATRSVTAPADGAYWHTRVVMETTHPRQLGSGPNRYWANTQRIFESWRSPEGKGWTGLRNLGARPKGAADEKAWRRDGSPATWNRAADGRSVSLTTKPDTGRLLPPKGPAAFSLAGQRLSYQELQLLPADPSGLKNWLRTAARVLAGEQAAGDIVDDTVTQELTHLLYESPVPKRVRTAAYQALRSTPGVRSLGKIDDSLGRTGEGLTIGRRQQGTTVSTTEVIVDTGTMLLLADGLKTTVNGKPLLEKTWTETVVQVGWTDDEPSIPGLP